ncbi:MAG: hypothetical protein HOY79_31355, partial [Streptomyces sp.]|nr:hypothetical protein [Streptomyces sp.]
MREYRCQQRRRVRPDLVCWRDFDSGVLGDDHHVVGRADDGVLDHDGVRADDGVLDRRWAGHRGCEAEHACRADHDPEPVDR